MDGAVTERGQGGRATVRGRGTRHRLLLAAGTLTALTALAGCSGSGDGPVCTLIGMDSGVTVAWRTADFPDDTTTVRVCVNGTCEERRSAEAEVPVLRVTVPLRQDIGGKTVTVRLTVTAGKDEHVVTTDARRVKLTEQHPNGASCPPTAWTATLRAHPSKGLISAKGLPLR
ncbi:hypothetical protein [Streptomyces fragilis]|uniref:Lipoprotein n=1 Tax=Streptomyces fragilis TaxID=67301 RepID=A0ABV2YDZ1_9ACTN|nr:hypothetical protein [Streptomyces fragilis]